MGVMQDHWHGRQDMTLVPPSPYCPSLQPCWPSECLPASPREIVGRSPKATSDLLLQFKGDDGGSRGSHVDVRARGENVAVQPWVRPWEQDSGESSWLCTLPGWAMAGSGPV